MTSVRDNKRSVFSNYCTTIPIYKDVVNTQKIMYILFIFNATVKTGQGESSNRRYNFL